ncbi:hypothetical protein ABTM62_19935, partial [Acinetobacter baumannii]
MAAEKPAQGSGAVLYYRDPHGRPVYSPTPKTTDAGEPFIPVYAGEDTTVAPARAKAEPSSRKIKFYRNPMGLP